MNTFDDLEPQQYQRQFWEDDVPLQDVRKSVLRKFVYLGTLLFILLVVLGSVLKFPDEVQLPFLLKADKSEEVYRFPFRVYVSAQQVASGMTVSTGQSLLKITSPEIVALIDQYTKAKQSVDNYQHGRVFSMQKQRAMLEVSIEQAELRSTQLKQELNALDATWKSNSKRLEFEANEAEKRMTQSEELYAGKYISTIELKEHERSHVQAADARMTALQQYQKDRSYMSNQLQQTVLEVTSLRREMEKLTLDGNYDSINLQNTLLLAANAIQNTFGDYAIMDGGIVLKAREPGVVSFVFEGDKEVAEGAILIKIRYRKSALFATASCPPSLIGKLALNQQVFLKVATFPSYEYGSVTGHVERLSLTADEKGNFTVRIALDDMKHF